jgi:hypothetical protein
MVRAVSHRSLVVRPRFAPVSVSVNLWREKRRWDRFFSELFGFILVMSYNRGSTLIYPLGDEQ